MRNKFYLAEHQKNILSTIYVIPNKHFKSQT